jgi:hypothetical protein
MLSFRDIAIIAICALVLAVTVVPAAKKDDPGPGLPPDGPPVARIAQALDIPADRLRAALEQVGPPSGSPDRAPTEQQIAAHSRKLAAILNVPVDRLRSIMDACLPLELAQ